MIGRLLGHYRVVSKIGEGGMGVVYRAHHEILNRDVGLKVLADSPAIERLGKDHLLHEARAGSALNHPNICTVHEIIEIDGELSIAMELIEGKSLTVLIGDTGLPVESVLRYGVQIAGALAHAHGRGIVHRDLKSANVVVTPDGLVKVLDFGLARRIPLDVPDESTMTFTAPDSSGSVSGTLFYMAPEVLRGESGDARGDLWALGVVLYEAAAGRPPFRGNTAFETSSAILQEMPPPLPGRMPPSLWAIIQRCLAKEPAQRYQQASEVKAALETVESAAMTGAQPSSQPAGYQTTVMRGIRHLRVSNTDVLLLIGTTKGAFLLRSTKQRSRWEVAGPYFHGHAVYAMAYDSRGGRHRLWASTNNFWGTFLRSSDDFGRTWTNPLEANLKFPADSGTSLIKHLADPSRRP
ncbi:MAG: serine/threonine-protein kinase [Vicinamibacterales bacterium]